ncbi:hypothetical protein B0H13DRAFT_1886393 [Mycena leptocephala]|nr:hypothetical protein B0H13DRAFT_1886393 [Mycena leptocephala]
MSPALNTMPCLPRLARRMISIDLLLRAHLRPQATSPTQAGLPACKQRPSNTEIPAHAKALLVAQRTSLQPRPLSRKDQGKSTPSSTSLPKLTHTSRPPPTHSLPGSSHALHSTQKKPKKRPSQEERKAVSQESGNDRK